MKFDQIEIIGAKVLVRPNPVPEKELLSQAREKSWIKHN